jgi:hypothetical protein
MTCSAKKPAPHLQPEETKEGSKDKGHISTQIGILMHWS